MVFQWFPMVANHWSDDGMVTIHRSGLAKVLIWTMAAWPASTLQLAPVLLYKKFVFVFVSRRYTNTYFMVSSSGFVWIYFCRVRPNSYTARLFGEKEAATGFKIAQESWNLCHHSVMSIFSLFCVSPCIFLDHHKSGCCIFATLPLFRVCLCLCVFFLRLRFCLCVFLTVHVL